MVGRINDERIFRQIIVIEILEHALNALVYGLYRSEVVAHVPAILPAHEFLVAHFAAGKFLEECLIARAEVRIPLGLL